MIIGLVGFIESGKNTIAEYLTSTYGFKQESFARALKDILSCIFSWDRNKLEGVTTEDRIWRNQIDAWWSQRLNIPNLTPRMMLQQIGTNLFRDHFDENIWIASLERKLQGQTNNTVVTDCRFPNEITSIKQLGGVVIRVRRGPDPAWYYDIVNLTSYQEIEQYSTAHNIHVSETAWIGQNIDHVIHNDQDLESLYMQVDQLIRLYQVSGHLASN